MKLFYVACAATVLFAACADRDPLSSTADLSTAYKAGKPLASSDPTAGLPEPRVAAQFTVRIENLGTFLAPGAWVAQRGGTPFFTDGQPDRGAGLEALAEDGNPAQLASTLHPNSGVFTTPVGADGPGPLTPGNAYEFTFVARPGDRLSFATMYVQSNDLFLAPGETGIALFTDDGLPISGDITDQIGLWDAGTEVNEEPGVGENQAPRQAGANTGADEGGAVRLVDDGFTYPAVTDIVRITVTSRGGLYIGTIDDGDMDGDASDGQTGLDIVITPDVLFLTNALISYFQDALLVALTSNEATLDGASGGTLAIAGNEWVLTDYSPDGTLVLNGTLNVGEDQIPSIPITGEIAASGAFNGTVSLDLLVDVSTAKPSATGTIIVGVPYDINDLLAAAEELAGDGDMDGDTSSDITAADVVDPETLEAFVLRAKEMLEALTAEEILAFLETFRSEGEWKSGPIYLFVSDLQGNMIFHGVDPSLEGQDLSDLEDLNGVKITQELLAQVANGGGFVEYLWDDPTIEGDEDRSSSKVGYAAPLSILGQEFAIGAGFYLNAVGMDGDMDDDADGDDDMDDDDSSEVPITSARTFSSDPAAGLAEPRVPAQFTVRIENIGTVLAPGAWVAQRGGEPFFTDGQPDHGAGLEALAEDGNPAQLAASLPRNSGVFTTPVGADGPGPLTPGNAYEFRFVARPGDRLSFATMYVQSNDLFLAPGETGIALFVDGQPISGDITDQIDLWDAGTEVNEEPGVGANQAPRQAAANTGADEGGVVRLVDDGYTYPAVADIVLITISSSGG
ncbi:MAG: spondin domain-containing protein [Gemmatimonadota bacterium]|nr:spondin domain-containing protein [Gemmatimonadota bacterium]